MSNGFSRRDVVKTSLVLLGSSCLPGPKSKANAQTAADPHFFLYVNLFPGADPSYMFDARPLSFTAANKMANYTGKEPEAWTGSNGQKTFASVVTAPMRALKDDFSIINGVMMSTFDGHDQNQAFVFTGSPFGGESFMPHLNRRNPLPLDTLLMSSLFGVHITNGGASLSTNPFAIASLSQIFQGNATSVIQDPTDGLIASRLEAAGAGAGSFSSGAKQMGKGFASSGELAGKLKATNIQNPTVDPSTGMIVQPAVPIKLQVVGEFFKRGITRSLVIGIDGDYDTHDPQRASQSPATFASTIDQLAALINYLKATPYDDASGKSLFDVTTVMVGSEFGRTMRQLDAPAIDKTGTDHNTLSNSFLLAGKGVKGGQVIGASDLTDLDAAGNLINASGAHKQLDNNLIKLMGRPFDYGTFAPVMDALPATFDNTQYLGFGAVANTIYRIFGYTEQDLPYRRFSAGGNVLPFLAPLIATTA